MTPETARARPWEVPGGGDCGDDESLFEYAQGGLGPDERRGVETHVSTCPDCRRVLAEALRGLAEVDGEESGGGGRHRIGRYSLVELLGAGASGVVYRAFDPELERTVALKLLRADASTESRERRLREARTMAQVSDPNVVTVFDAGLSGGSVYIVMEYVQGSTLEEWLRRDPRTLREIVEAFIAAGRGLSALHARSLVHRDFKPENVMVRSDGRIQVTDFGLARADNSIDAISAEEGAPAGTRVTVTHGVCGTPAYMAPELFTGSPADARSDQFSFAVALLSATTGHHPFGADEHISVSELVLRMHRDRRELAEKARGLPGRLRDALLRALCLDAKERFSTMAALIAELERAPIREARRTSRRTASTAVLTLALVAFALILRGWPRRTPNRETDLGARVAVAPPPPMAVPERAAPAASAPAPVAASKRPGSAEKNGTKAAAHAPSHRPTRATTLGSPRTGTPSPTEARYDDRLKDPF